MLETLQKGLERNIDTCYIDFFQAFSHKLVHRER